MRQIGMVEARFVVNGYINSKRYKSLLTLSMLYPPYGRRGSDCTFLFFLNMYLKLTQCLIFGLNIPKVLHKSHNQSLKPGRQR